MDVWIVVLAGCSAILLILLLFQSVRYSRVLAARRQAEAELVSKRKTLESYEKIAPKNLLALIKAEGSEYPEIGAHRQVNAVIMDVNIAGFEELYHTKPAGQVIESINEALAGIVPIITENGGVVESFREAGLMALFGEGYERPVSAAVSICGITGGKERESATVGMSDGSVLMGAVGYGDRMSVLALTGDCRLATFLRVIGHKYNAKILVTARVLERIPEGLRRFNCRWLGYIQVSEAQTLEKIYDVYDGDRADTRNNKRKTKLVFEKGVTLFAEGEFLQARQHFIEVLKTDSHDKAAKEYLLLCDAIFNKQHPQVCYIEKYR